MMQWVAQIIGNYGIERMPVFGYSVQIIHSKYAITPIVAIKGAGISEKCPGCGSDAGEARYLYTDQENHDLDYDIVSMTCLECGCVFSVKGDKCREMPKNLLLGIFKVKE